MFNLVKNELIKLSHKKGIYIYSIIILIILAASTIMSKIYSESVAPGGMTEDYYTYLKEGLSEYNLKNVNELEEYVNDLTEVEVYELIKEKQVTEYSSADYYYIDTYVKNGMLELNRAKYITKDEEEIKSAQKKVDELISDINKNNWKDDLKEEKSILEELLKGTTSEKDKQKIKDELLAVDYRLKNDIPPAYSSASEMIDEFLAASVAYHEMDKDKEEKTHREKMDKMNTEKNYFLLKYKLENNVVPKDKNLDIFVDSFAYLEADVLVAILLIMGGIVAEEFNKGTVKQLFVRPFRRWKILVSKMIAGAIAIGLFIIFYNVICLVAELIDGVSLNTFKDPILVYNFAKGEVVAYNIFAYIGITFLATLPEIIFYMAVCLLVGVITTSTIASIVATIGIQIIPAMVKFTDKVEAILPYNCLNFNKFLFGAVPQNEYQTFIVALIVWIISMVIINILMFWIFEKKEVKNQ